MVCVHHRNEAGRESLAGSQFNYFLGIVVGHQESAFDLGGLPEQFFVVQIVVGVEALAGALAVLSCGVGRVYEKSCRVLLCESLDDFDAVALDEGDFFADTLDVSDSPG